VYYGVKQTFRSKRSEEPFYNMAEIKACLAFKGKLVENRIELDRLKEMVHARKILIISDLKPL
jgi:hypothetical protein